MPLLPSLKLHLTLQHMHNGEARYSPLARAAPGGDGRECRPQGRHVVEGEDATTVFLVGLLFPESFGHACRIQHLHRLADLEAIFGAAGLLATHVSNASFRVAAVCTGRTPPPHALTPSLCGRQRSPSLFVLAYPVGEEHGTSHDDQDREEAEEEGGYPGKLGLKQGRIRHLSTLCSRPLVRLSPAGNLLGGNS